jgi:hypothetical protein
MVNTHIVDFSNLEGPVYTGRDRGEALRKQLHIEEFDDDNASVNVIIPASTYTVSSSFFLGMFGPSVRKLGSLELFWKKFQFNAPKPLMPLLEAHAARALQGRQLIG